MLSHMKKVIRLGSELRVSSEPFIASPAYSSKMWFRVWFRTSNGLQRNERQFGTFNAQTSVKIFSSPLKNGSELPRLQTPLGSELRRSSEPSVSLNTPHYQPKHLIIKTWHLPCQTAN